MDCSRGNSFNKTQVQGIMEKPDTFDLIKI